MHEKYMNINKAENSNLALPGLFTHYQFSYPSRQFFFYFYTYKSSITMKWSYPPLSFTLHIFLSILLLRKVMRCIGKGMSQEWVRDQLLVFIRLTSRCLGIEMSNRSPLFHQLSADGFGNTGIHVCKNDEAMR